jgi:thiamine biosynthesis lipoprotein
MMHVEPRTHLFPAFGTSVELLQWGTSERDAEELSAAVMARAERWERLFSRFRPESELCRVNRGSGQWESVSSDFFRVVADALEGYIATGGRFDPAILTTLERAGYDRRFVAMAGNVAVPMDEGIDSEVRNGTMLDIELDESASAIRLPVGLRIDLGGIAKGAFVDSVGDLMRGCSGVMLNAGGDIRAWGYPGADDCWRIGVEHPGDLERDIAELELHAGPSVAVATSSTRTRTWLAGVERQNHLIDPRERRPVPWSTPSVTAVARTVTDAEIQAKSVLIAISRGEPVPYTNADFVLVAYEDGRYETITPDANVA